MSTSHGTQGKRQVCMATALDTPHAETRETLKVLEELEKPDMGGKGLKSQQWRSWDMRISNLRPACTTCKRKASKVITGKFCTQNAKERKKMCWRFGWVVDTWIPLLTRPDWATKVLVSTEPGEDKTFCDSSMGAATQVAHNCPKSCSNWEKP